MTITKGVKALVNEANKAIITISTKEAIEAHKDETIVFVDVRDVRELEREGVIPGAFHAPRGMLEFWVDPESPYHKKIFSTKNKTFILYCQSAWRSALATKTLQDMGMSNVKHFSDGFNGWKRDGGPIEERNIK